jgi:hypothetical protein
MKRLIQIVRDDVHGIFDRDIGGKVVLMTMDARHLTRMLPEVLEAFINAEFKKGVIVSYDRPGNCIRSTLKKLWIPADRLVIIDGATRLGGLPEDRKAADDGGAAVRVLEDPFDIGCLETTLKETLRKDFSAKASGPDTDPTAPAKETLEDEILRAELGRYGLRGQEWSMMRHRIVQRVKDRVRDLGPSDEGNDPFRIFPTKVTFSVDEGQTPCREGADFIIVENLAVVSAYLSHENIDRLLRSLRSFVAEGLCRFVLVFLDREQYQWVIDGLKEVPDIEFELETNIYMGVTGYRFVPNDNGC